MKQISKPAMIAIAISFFIISCNSEDKKTESSGSDSTATTTTTPDATTSQPQGVDAVTAAPGLYAVVKDTMGIRVLNVLYKPGDSSAMHSHPDNALYVIDGGKGEFTGKDGSKQIIDLKSGMAMIRGGEAHSVKKCWHHYAESNFS